MIGLPCGEEIMTEQFL